MDGDGYDDVTGASTTPEYSRWKFGGASGGYGDSYGGYGGGYRSHADDYAQKKAGSQVAQKGMPEDAPQAQPAKKEEADQGDLTAEEETELKGIPEKQQGSKQEEGTDALDSLDAFDKIPQKSAVKQNVVQK